MGPIWPKKEKKMTKHQRIVKITFCAIMIALIFTLSWTVLGMIPIGLVSATTVFIPVIMGIIVLNDFKYSCILGFAFGFISFLRALVAPTTVLDPFFQNPLVSILPRFLMAIASYFIYKGSCKVIKNKFVNYLILGFSVAFLNTLFTISMLSVVYYNDITSLLISSNLSWGAWLFAGIALTNMLPEIALGMISSAICGKTYEKIKGDN